MMKFAHLDGQLVNVGTAVNIYTLPDVNTEAQFKIVISNRSAAAQTYNLWVAKTGTVAAGDEIANGHSIPGNTTFEITGYSLNGADGLGAVVFQTGVGGVLTVSVHGNERGI